MSLIICRQSLSSAGGAPRERRNGIQMGDRGNEWKSRKALRVAHFGPFWPTGRSGHPEQTKSWHTGLYSDGKTALEAAGRFFGEKRQK
jgi:hypothetical protein